MIADRFFKTLHTRSTPWRKTSLIAKKVNIKRIAISYFEDDEALL